MANVRATSKSNGKSQMLHDSVRQRAQHVNGQLRKSALSFRAYARCRSLTGCTARNPHQMLLRFNSPCTHVFKMLPGCFHDLESNSGDKRKTMRKNCARCVFAMCCFEVFRFSQKCAEKFPTVLSHECFCDCCSSTKTSRFVLRIVLAENMKKTSQTQSHVFVPRGKTQGISVSCAPKFFVHGLGSRTRRGGTLGRGPAMRCSREVERIKVWYPDPCALHLS